MVKKLTLDEVKEKLKLINPNIKILSTEYINSKEKMNCHCLKCNTVWKINWNNLSNNNGCPTCYHSSKLLSEEEIIKLVLENGYDFIEFINKGKTFKEYRIKVKCPEEHVYEVSYQSFQNGRRCKKCGYEIVANKTKNNINEVMQFITDQGYTLVGEFNYKNNKSDFTIMCKHGHLRKTCFNYLTQTPSCSECSLGHKYKYSGDDISIILQELGMEYIEGYIDVNTPFKYKCTCGNKSYGYLKKLRNGSKCPNCSSITKWTFEEIKKIFKSLNCELLSTEFINTKQKLEFKCNCGKISSKILYDFIKSPQCGQCGHGKYSGENHYNWNPNLTNDERMKNRKFKEYDNWRMSVYKRDHYVCQCCGDNKGGNLNAHHLDSHDWAKDKRLDIDNGITLCELCHTDFHNLYGYGDNTKEQFEEYVKDLLNNAI